MGGVLSCKDATLPDKPLAGACFQQVTPGVQDGDRNGVIGAEQ